ncbi:MAG: YDG domain-containing protein [Gemmataceae bacterium]
MFSFRHWIKTITRKTHIRPARRTKRNRNLALWTLEDRTAPSVTAIDIKSLTSTTDYDGTLNEHVSVAAGQSVSVNFDYTVGSAAANTSYRAEIWNSSFTGSALKTGATTTIINQATGSFNRTATVTSTGLTPGSYGLRIIVNHGGGSPTTSFDQDANSLQIVTFVAPTVTLSVPNSIYDGNAYSSASVSLAPAAASSGGDSAVRYYANSSDASSDLNSIAAPKNVNGYYSRAFYTSDNLDHGGTVYLDASSSSQSFQITPKTISASFTVADRVYNGTDAATIATGPTLSGVVTGDTVGVSFTDATFSDKNVGNNKTITLNGAALNGGDSGNYFLTTPVTTTASISAAHLTATFSVNDRTYNGSALAAIATGPTLNGIFFSDVVNLAYTNATFANKNVGLNKTVTLNGTSLSGGDSGNYVLDPATTTATISARDLHVSYSADSRVYDSTKNATVHESDDSISGDDLVVSFASALFDTKNVGNSKPVHVAAISTSGADATNYNLINSSYDTTADISAFALTVSATGVNRVYDSTTNATANLSDNRFLGDVFTDSYTSASFNNKNVGTGKPVSVSGISISGTDAGNYTFNTTASATADITPFALTVSATGVNRVYDSTTNATVNLSDNRFGGDVFTDSYTSASFADKNVGTGKPVSVSGISISGTDAGNYTFNSTASTTANITPFALTVTATGVNRVYDSTTGATVNLSDNRFGGDVFTDSYTSASFADKNVGTGKPVSVSGISISGTDAGNYSYNTSAMTVANITPYALTVSAAGVSRVYDATTGATVNLSDDRFLGDVFTDSYTTASFADKNVGNTKPVSVSGISISGTDAGNYSFNTTASATADITPFALTVSATGVNRVYDSTTNATVNLSDNRFFGDVLTDSYTSASFADKNVGTGKPVSVSGISISGTDAGNYSFNTSAMTTANITPFALTVSATGVDKIYDSTSGATVNLSDNRFGGDIFTDSYTSASFNNKNVGMNKPVSVTGISISGTDAGNYSFNTSAMTTANITARDLNVTATGNNRVYDGTTSATVNLFDDRIAGDLFSFSYVANFNNKNVGTAKPVHVMSITISGGADAGNYNLLNSTYDTTANITKRDLNTTAMGDNRVYDGTTLATATLSDDRVSGDILTYTYSASFDDKNVGSAKPVHVTGIAVVGGADSINYTLLNNSYETTADITVRTLNIYAVSDTRTYDGTILSSGVVTASGLQPGDTLIDMKQVFDSRHAGSRTLLVSEYTLDDGNNNGNYTVVEFTAPGSITQRALDIYAVHDSRTYDATVASNQIPTFQANGKSAGILYNGDTFTSLTQVFTSRNVLGVDNSTLVPNYVINDGNGGNDYAVSTHSSPGTVTLADLYLFAQPDSRIYDGTTSSSVSPTIVGLFDGDTVSPLAQTFDSRDVGSRTLSVTTYTVNDQNAGGNYLVHLSTASGSISKATLDIFATADNRVYNGTAASTLVPSYTGLQTGDSLTGLVQVFDSRNVGARTLSVSAYSLVDGNAGGNYNVFTHNIAGSISKAALDIYATTDSRTYDGTAASSVAPSYTGLQTGDSLTGLVQVFDSRNAGPRTLSVSAYSLTDGNAGGNYDVFTHTVSGSISKRALDIFATTDSRAYDGTATSAALPTSTGLQTGDTLTGLVEVFDSRNAGARTMSVSAYSLSDGNAGGNYDVFTHTASGSITQRGLDIYATTDSRTYDGTTGSSAAPTFQADGLAAGLLYDTDSFSALSQAFASRNVMGAGNSTLVASYTLADGNSGGNYAVTTHTAAGTISKAALDIFATSDSRGYDGTTASAAVPTSTGLQTGDSLTGLVQMFDSKNAGARTLSVTSYTLTDGNAGGNYNVVTHTANGSISKASLTIVATPFSRDYDGTAISSALPSYGGLQPGDSLTDLVQVFDSRNAGPRILSVVGYTLTDGNGGNNYTVSTEDAAGTIFKAQLDINATTDSRVYDGTSSSSVAPTYFGLQSGDTLTGLQQSFDSKNAGSRILTVSAYSLADGNGGNNYDVFTHDAVGSISKATLDINAVTDSRTYNGTAASSALPTYTGLQTGDSLSSLVEAFDSRDAGPRTLSVVAYTLGDGNGGGNYNVFTHTAAGSISKADLFISAHTDSRGYDGTANSSVSPDVTGVQTGDNVSGLSQVFDSKNAGARTLSVATYTVNDGNLGNNYTVHLATAAGTISQATLDIFAVSDSRTYDGTTDSAGMPTWSGLFTGDTLDGLVQEFDSRNAGARMLDVSEYTLDDGNNGNNYDLVFHGAAGSISQADLDITAVSDARGYNGTTNSTGTPMVAGLFAPDNVSGLSQVFDSRNAGSRTLSVNTYTVNDGNLGGNYAVHLHTAAGSISKADVDIFATSQTRIYDATTNSTAVPSVTGVQTGDSVNSLTQAFDSTNAGARTLSVTGYTVNDANSGNNYNVHLHTAAGTINKATAGIVVDDYTGDYDAAFHGLTPHITGVAGESDNISLGFSGDSFKNAGSHVANWSFSGAPNYEDASGAGNVTINQVHASILVNGYTGDYDTFAHGATGSASGPDGNLSGFLNLGASYTNAPGGVAHWTFNAGSNYFTESGDVNIDIGKVHASILVNGYTGTYDAASHGATGSASGPDGNLSGFLNFGASYINAPGGNAHWTFNAGGNYFTESGDVAIVINKAATHVTVTWADGAGVIYDGASHSATARWDSNGVDAEGANGLTVSYQKWNGTSWDNIGGAPSAAGLYQAIASFAGNTNHNGSSGATSFTISQKHLTAGFNAANRVYNGNTSATVTSGPTLIGVVSGDTVTLSYTDATFSDKNAGVNKVVTLNGGTLGGASGANYVLDVSTTTATITAKSITASFTADNKFFDNTTDAVVHTSVSGVIGGDVVSMVVVVPHFASSVPGTWSVRGNSYTLSGADAGNYSLSSVGSPPSATISFPTNDFNVTTAATQNLSLATNSTVTAHIDDVPTLQAIATGGFAFRQVFFSALTGKTVTLSAAIVGGSYTGTAFGLSSAASAANMSKLVTAANTSPGSATNITVTDQVNINGTWYALSVATFGGYIP